MPVISDLSISSVTYDKVALTLTVVGVAFSDNRYGGGIELSHNGGAYSTPAGTYTSWGDSEVVYTLDAVLLSGSYTVRLTNGDGEVVTEILIVPASHAILSNLNCGLMIST